jgi:hypothetical protein
MADAAPEDTAPGDPLLPEPDIDPALFARLAADPLAGRLVGTALARVLPTDRPWAAA